MAEDSSAHASAPAFPGESQPVLVARPAGGTFAALAHRNYRLWFIGQLVSLLGTWMQVTAQGFLVFDLTHSSAYLGYVAFAAGIPAWLLMLYGGVVADRLPRRALIIATQVWMMALATALATLAFTGLVKPWHILLLAALTGVATAFDAPARQAFVLELVGRADLQNAIALNSTMFNTATALGPAIGGQVYAAVGPGWCFALNAVSFLAVIGALLAMRLEPRPIETRRTSTHHEILEGLRHAASRGDIRRLLGLLAVTSLFGCAFISLLPAWAVRTLHGDAATNGWLQSARGIGALAGALAIASLSRSARKGRLLFLGTLLFPITGLLFSFIRDTPYALLCLVASGAAMIVVFNLLNALVQLQTADALRGRVMAIYSLTFFGSIPLCGLWAGALAEHVGEPWAVVTGSLLALIGAAAIWIRSPSLRRL